MREFISTVFLNDRCVIRLAEMVQLLLHDLIFQVLRICSLFPPMARGVHHFGKLTSWRGVYNNLYMTICMRQFFHILNIADDLKTRGVTFDFLHISFLLKVATPVVVSL